MENSYYSFGEYRVKILISVYANSQSYKFCYWPAKTKYIQCAIIHVGVIESVSLKLGLLLFY